MRAADMTRRYTRHSPPFLREDPEPRFRERTVRFLDRMGVTAKVEGANRFDFMPKIKLYDLTPEALDRLTCDQIEKFWAYRARRTANLHELASWHAGSRDSDYLREDREERRRLDREYPMAAK